MWRALSCLRSSQACPAGGGGSRSLDALRYLTGFKIAKRNTEKEIEELTNKFRRAGSGYDEEAAHDGYKNS